MLATAIDSRRGFVLGSPGVVIFALTLLVGSLPLTLPAMVIYDELCRGVVSGRSRGAVLALIGSLQVQGAQAVALGCTEITLLIDAACSPLPVFDTTALHAAAAVSWLLEECETE